MSGVQAVAVEPPAVDVDLEFLVLVEAGRELGDLVEREAGRQLDRPRERQVLVAPDDRLEVGRGLAQDAGGEIEAGRHVGARERSNIRL